MSFDPEGMFFSNLAQSYYKHFRAYDSRRSVTNNAEDPLSNSACALTTPRGVSTIT